MQITQEEKSVTPLRISPLSQGERSAVTLTLGKCMHDRQPVDQERGEAAFVFSPSAYSLEVHSKGQNGRSFGCFFFMYNFLLGRCQEQSRCISEGLAIHPVIHHRLSVSQACPWVHEGESDMGLYAEFSLEGEMEL